jgi:hypothetical protein
MATRQDRVATAQLEPVSEADDAWRAGVFLGHDIGPDGPGWRLSELRFVFNSRRSRYTLRVRTAAKELVGLKRRVVETHMFWAYGNFSNLEILCATSFLRHGYQLNIWTYAGLSNAPTGVKYRNARKIITEDQVFLNKRGSYASFADWFRYTLLSEVGGLYVDTDVVTLLPADKLPKRKFLVTERVQGLQDGVKINSNVIFNPTPSNGDLIELARRHSASFPKAEASWSELGPDLLTAMVHRYPKHGFDIKPPNFANPIDWWDCPTAFLGTARTLPSGVAFVHLYNERWRVQQVDKDSPFPEGSLIDAIRRRIQG